MVRPDRDRHRSVVNMDRYELANFNRQAGATVSTLNRPKVEVMAEMARDINPQADVRSFPEGIAEALHISLPAVKSRVHRSRLFLRQRLGDAADPRQS